MQNYKGYIYQNEDAYIFSIEKREDDTVIVYVLGSKFIENDIKYAIEKDSLIKEIYYDFDSLIGNNLKSLINGFVHFNDASKGYSLINGKWLYLDEFQIFDKTVLMQPISRQKFYLKKGNIFIVNELTEEEALFTDFKYFEDKNVDTLPLHANATLIKEKNEYLIDCKYLLFDSTLPYTKFIVDSTFHITSYFYNNKWYDLSCK